MLLFSNPHWMHGDNAMIKEGPSNDSASFNAYIDC